MSDFLFARPKVVDGLASFVDLFGVYTIYNESENGADADRRARQADLQALREDCNIAFSQVKKICQQKEPL